VGRLIRAQERSAALAIAASSVSCINPRLNHGTAGSSPDALCLGETYSSCAFHSRFDQVILHYSTESAATQSTSLFEEPFQELVRELESQASMTWPHILHAKRCELDKGQHECMRRDRPCGNAPSTTLENDFFQAWMQSIGIAACPKCNRHPSFDLNNDSTIHRFSAHRQEFV
jgi:hypothetical protein